MHKCNCISVIVIVGNTYNYYCILVLAIAISSTVKVATVVASVIAIVIIIGIKVIIVITIAIIIAICISFAQRLVFALGARLGLLGLGGPQNVILGSSVLAFFLLELYTIRAH